MKTNIKIYFIALIVASLAYGCKKSELLTYETEVSRLYVDMPLKEGSRTEKAEELAYSFAWDDNSVKSQIIELPLTVVGVAKDYDREVSLSVIVEKTTATDSDWDNSSIVNVIVPKGETQINVPIQVNRSESIKTESLEVHIRINSNEHFQLMTEELSTVKVRFSDILEEPSWWNGFVRYFGPYQPEIYRQWRIIYYEGFDTGTNYSYGGTLSWDNMPSSHHPSWYPVLDLAITIMKTYFLENDVYPGGDTTKDPIRLP